MEEIKVIEKSEDKNEFKNISSLNKANFIIGIIGILTHFIISLIKSITNYVYVHEYNNNGFTNKYISLVNIYNSIDNTQIVFISIFGVLGIIFLILSFLKLKNKENKNIFNILGLIFNSISSYLFIVFIITLILYYVII